MELELIKYLQWKLKSGIDSIDYTEVSKYLNIDNRESEELLLHMYDMNYLCLYVNFYCENCGEFINKKVAIEYDAIKCSNCGVEYNLQDYIRGLDYYYKINKSMLYKEKKTTMPFRRNLYSENLESEILNESINFGSNNKEEVIIMNQDMSAKEKVFIVHGHDEVLKLKVSNWLYELQLEPIILHEKANGGTASILAKINKYSEVSCAIVLLTADDIVKGKKDMEYNDRARQNVIFEAGYFIGKLGESRVILLMEPSVDKPGDLGGCIYIEADEKDGWKELIRREFKEMKINYLA